MLKKGAVQMSNQSQLQVIGRNIQQYRNNLGITQEELSEVLGISASYISKMERGKKPTKLKDFFLLLSQSADEEQRTRLCKQIILELGYEG